MITRSHLKGRCDHCKLVACWTGAPRLRDALCPRCYQPLRRTSWACRFPRVEEVAYPRASAPVRLGGRAS